MLIRAARGVYVNPHARSLPADTRRGLLRFLRPREISYVSLGMSIRLGGRRYLAGHDRAWPVMTTGSPGLVRYASWGAVGLAPIRIDRVPGRNLRCSSGRRSDRGHRSAPPSATLRRVGRNLWISLTEEILADAIAEEENLSMSSKVRCTQERDRRLHPARHRRGPWSRTSRRRRYHLHLLSALSEAGVLRHVVFQGGTQHIASLLWRRALRRGPRLRLRQGWRYLDGVEFDPGGQG